ncbi:MAG: hypothetical protein HYY10_01745 [Candidatus Liptonbacteria bacterium]|nr:hypothetical protein [Candidatus Liptonbacteria bacterium]
MPSVIPHLPASKLSELVFTRPKVGAGIVMYNTTAHDRPQLQAISAAMIILVKNWVIPTHVNEEKEKMYFCTKGLASVLLFLEGAPRWFSLEPGGSAWLCVPPRCPHAIWCLEASEIYVVGSAQVDDVVWQEDVEELIKNEHR